MFYKEKNIYEKDERGKYEKKHKCEGKCAKKQNNKNQKKKNEEKCFQYTYLTKFLMVIIFMLCFSCDFFFFHFLLLFQNFPLFILNWKLNNDEHYLGIVFGLDS